MSKPVHILVRMPNWLGDCIMAMPALRHLRETLPTAQLYLSGRRAFAGLFRCQPGVAGFVEAPDSGLGKLIKGMSDTRRIVRESGMSAPIDVGLLLTNSLSTAAWMWRTGAEVRIGYDLDCRRFFLTHPVPCGGVEQSWHFIKYYLWLAQTLESILSADEEIPRRQVEPLAAYQYPTLCISDAGREEAAALRQSVGVSGPYAVIAPASAYGPVKDWPPEYYRELVSILNKQYGYSVLITGGRDQADVCQSIADGHAAAFNVAGQTSLDGFAALLADASLFVGGDSGGAHVAAALEIPTIVIFGITNPSRTRPTGLRVATLGEGEDKDIKLNTMEAREAAKLALSSIRPEKVAETVRSLLACNPAAQ